MQTSPDPTQRGSTHPSAHAGENAHPEAEQPALLNVGPADPLAFATLVSVDGRRVRLSRENGCAVISIEGRQPVTLDKFQTAAFRLAAASLGDAS